MTSKSFLLLKQMSDEVMGRLIDADEVYFPEIVKQWEQFMETLDIMMQED